MPRPPAPKTHKEVVEEFLGKVFKKTKESAQILKPHSRKDKFTIRFLRHYLSPREVRRVSRYIKQKKAKIQIERKGFSFLISGRDFLPVVVSKFGRIRKINETIEARFWREKNAEFSKRAWTVFPEYIGPIILGQRKLKAFLMLLIFGDKISAAVIDRYGTARKLSQQAKFFGDFKLTVLYKKPTGRGYGVTFRTKRPQLGKFAGVAKEASRAVHLKECDLEFLERYVETGKKIKVKVPRALEKRLKTKTKVALAVASARVDLRKVVTDRDVTRVNDILK